MGEIHIFCPIPLKGNKSKCRRLGKKHKNGVLEGEKVSIGSKAGVEKTKHVEEVALLLGEAVPMLRDRMNSCCARDRADHRTICASGALIRCADDDEAASQRDRSFRPGSGPRSPKSSERASKGDDVKE